MTRRYLAYNPALLTDAELVETFVVRQVDLELVLETIRDNDGSSNQHLVVVGARGMGKTTLVSRVALAVKHDAELASRWTPVLFGEESYDVGSVGGLWLKALERLAETVGGSRWREAFEAVRQERDEERLRDRALGRLLDYARDSQTRILLVVENLDMMLGEQIEPDDAWTLRHALQQHPEIMLLATAIDYAGVFGRRDLPLYGFAREHRLQPLSLGETRELWARVAKEQRSERAMIPIHRLTGGNPRLVTIVASFSDGRSFRQLMDELTALIDEHTSYFKATIEVLPATERRVYSTLADLWAPATSRQVAERCRMSVSKASALLSRLVARGMVEEVDNSARSKRFQLVERLYNVYHVLRNRGGEQRPRLKGLVEFMALFYESDDLVEVMGKLAREATELPHEHWGEYLEAYALLMDKLPDQSEVFRVTPDAFLVRLLSLQAPGIDASLVSEVLSTAKPGLLAINRFLESPQEATAIAAIAALAKLFQVEESRVLARLLEVLTLEAATPRRDAGRTSWAQHFLPVAARLLLWTGHMTAALSALERLRKVFPEERDVLTSIAVVLAHMGRVDEALVHARTITAAVPDDPKAWALMGHLLETKADYTNAAAAYRRSIEASPDPRTQLRLAAALSHAGHHMDEARRLARAVAFEDGELSHWLIIAETDTDPEHALEIARQVFVKGDLRMSASAIQVLHKTMGDHARFMSFLRDTVRTHRSSAGAVIGLLVGLEAVEKSGTGVDDPWPVVEMLLKHPVWKVEPIRMAAMAGPTVLRLARLDSARALALLDGVGDDAAANPIVLAMRMELGGDVPDAPAELLQVARDIVSVLTQAADAIASSCPPPPTRPVARGRGRGYEGFRR
jgi:tetratricopeptide (TPR) repeat protein